MNEQSLKECTAKNIAAYRKAIGWTQGELAEKLNYSDKAISKWERGESLPDIYILKLLADLFGVTLDDLIRNHGNRKIRRPRRFFQKKILIPLLSIGLVWLVATNIFAFLIMLGRPEGAYFAFIAAIPASFIVLTVFSNIWWRPILTAVFISGIIWSMAMLLYLTISNEFAYMLFIIAVPLQILEILWTIMRKSPSKKNKTIPSQEPKNE